MVADVHTGEGQCLEEGVGHANEIYVVVPIEGKLYLTTGGGLLLLRVPQPSSDRLTDEAWQTMLKQEEAPHRRRPGSGASCRAEHGGDSAAEGRRSAGLLASRRTVLFLGVAILLIVPNGCTRHKAHPPAPGADGHSCGGR